MIDTLSTTEESRRRASEARHGGRAITAALARQVPYFAEPGTFQTVIATGSPDPVPVWIAALAGKLGADRIADCWHNMIDPGGYSSPKTGWTYIAEKATRGHDGSSRPVFLTAAEAMLDWPIYRAALAAGVTIVRHPDNANEITTTGPVEVVDVDLGSSFDGTPHGREEREIAADMGQQVLISAKRLPKGAAQDAALNMGYELIGYAPRGYLDDDEGLDA